MSEREEKMRFVEEQKKELKKYSVIGVLPVNGIPDRLVQASRNKMRKQAKFIIAKKSLLTRILEGDERTKHLAKELTGMSAIILSNEDPFALYHGFRANTLKLGAKPKSVAPEDINIQAGETSIQPGQAVTELKLAGIDVQIQKGKVVIAKDKTLVKKGAVISGAVAKALKTLDIQPFTATIEPTVLLSGNLMFTREVLKIDTQTVVAQMSQGFAVAFAISVSAKIVNSYTVVRFVETSYREAMALGIAANMPEPGITEKLLANAALQAASLGGMMKEETPAPASEEKK